MLSPDYLVVAVFLGSNFFYACNFLVVDRLQSIIKPCPRVPRESLFICSLSTPICLDQFGWSESEAILYLGILMTVGGVISVFTFGAVGPLAKR